jgi:hypothetical protein
MSGISSSSGSVPFIDGEQLSRCKQDWGIEGVIPMKKNMDIWADVWALAQRENWQPVPEVPPSVVPILPARPERLRRREANRQKTLAQRKQVLPAPPDQERYIHRW